MKKNALLLVLNFISFISFCQLPAPTVSGLPDNSTTNTIRFTIDNTTSSNTFYEITRSSPSGPIITTTAALPSGSAYVLGGLMAKTNYTVSVRAFNCSTLPCSSLSSSSVPVNIGTKVDFPPRVNITFSQNCAFFTGMVITPVERGEDIETIIIRDNFGNSTALPGGTRIWYDQSTQAGRGVQYTVTTVNATGVTNSTAPGLSVPPYVAPPVPININSDNSKKTDKSVTIRWTNQDFDEICKTNVPSAIYLSLKRAGESDYKVIDVLYPTANSYKIDGLNEKEEIELRFTILSDQGKQSFAVFKDTTFGKPYAPSNLIVEVFPDDPFKRSAFDISWKGNVRDEDYYDIEYSLDSTNFLPLGRIKSSETRFRHIGLEEGVKYYYRVKAGNFLYGQGPYSKITFGSPVGYSKAPNAPLLVKALKGTGNTINLTWKDDSNNEEFFVIERKSSPDTSFKEIKKLGRNITNLVDTDVSAGKKYIYRIKTTNPLGVSTYSSSREVELSGTVASLNNEIAKVFPNPTADFLKIDLSDLNLTGTTSARILNISSKEVMRFNITDKVKLIDLSSFTEGLYTLVLENGSYTYSEKLYKK